MRCQQTTHTVSIVFEEPFWIALFEFYKEGRYSVAREVIGSSEPTNAEVVMFFERLDQNKLHYTTPTEDIQTRCVNVSFKRQQRMARKAMQQTELRNVFTKAQAEIKRQHIIDNCEKKRQHRMQLELDKERKFLLRQAKKKEKHRGH